MAEDPKITELLGDEHKKVVAYVNQVIGTSTAAMSAAEAPYKDAPIIDFINHVQAETVKAALAGTEYAALPVLSQASCFSRTARDPGRGGDDPGCGGVVSVREHAGGAAADGCADEGLPGVLGAVLRADAGGWAVDPAKLTNADNTPDYNYDAVCGSTYEIDIAKPVGSRIAGLSFDGQAGRIRRRSSCWR